MIFLLNIFCDFTIFVYFSILCDFTNFLRYYFSIFNPLWLPLSLLQSPEQGQQAKKWKDKACLRDPRLKMFVVTRQLKNDILLFPMLTKYFFWHCSTTLQRASSFLKNATLIYVGNFFARSIYRSISLTIEVSTYVSNVTSIVTKSNLFWIIL